MASLKTVEERKALLEKLYDKALAANELRLAFDILRSISAHEV